jgi:hypothetical protein
MTPEKEVAPFDKWFIEKRIGQDGKERTGGIPPVEKVVDPFDKWFEKHVVQGDVFEALPPDPLKKSIQVVQLHHLRIEKNEL